MPWASRAHALSCAGIAAPLALPLQPARPSTPHFMLSTAAPWCCAARALPQCLRAAPVSTLHQWMRRARC
eukprot:869895-Alexandrium_andersonii.AAC.1